MLPYPSPNGHPYGGMVDELAQAKEDEEKKKEENQHPLNNNDRMKDVISFTNAINSGKRDSVSPLGESLALTRNTIDASEIDSTQSQLTLHHTTSTDLYHPSKQSSNICSLSSTVAMETVALPTDSSSIAVTRVGWLASSSSSPSNVHQAVTENQIEFNRHFSIGNERTATFVSISSAPDCIDIPPMVSIAPLVSANNSMSSECGESIDVSTAPSPMSSAPPPQLTQEQPQDCVRVTSVYGLADSIKSQPESITIKDSFANVSHETLPSLNRSHQSIVSSPIRLMKKPIPTPLQSPKIRSIRLNQSSAPSPSMLPIPVFASAAALKSFPPTCELPAPMWQLHHEAQQSKRLPSETPIAAAATSHSHARLPSPSNPLPSPSYQMPANQSSALETLPQSSATLPLASIKPVAASKCRLASELLLQLVHEMTTHGSLLPSHRPLRDEASFIEWIDFLNKDSHSLSDHVHDHSIRSNLCHQLLDQLMLLDDKLEDELHELQLHRMESDNCPNYQLTEEDTYATMEQRMPKNISLVIATSMDEIREFSSALALQVIMPASDCSLANHDERAVNLNPPIEQFLLPSGPLHFKPILWRPSSKARTNGPIGVYYHQEAIERQRRMYEQYIHQDELQIEPFASYHVYLPEAVQRLFLNDNQLKLELTRDVYHAKILWNYYIKRQNMTISLRLRPNEEEASLTLIHSTNIGRLVSFGGIVHSIGPVKLGHIRQCCLVSQQSMQDDLLRAGDDDDAHAPYQQIPIQTVTIIPIALPTSNTAPRIEQDSDVGMSSQVRVDIDGELVGGFAIGDEVVGIGRLRIDSSNDQVNRSKYRQTDADERLDSHDESRPRHLMIQANNLMLTKSVQWMDTNQFEQKKMILLMGDIKKALLPKQQLFQGCDVRDWALTEMMIEFFCLDATPGSSFPLLKLQLMLSLISGDGSGLVGNIDQDKTYGRDIPIDASPMLRTPSTPTVRSPLAQSPSSSSSPSASKLHSRRPGRHWNQPLNVFIRGRSITTSGVTMLLQAAAKFAHRSVHHQIITNGPNKQKQNARIGHLREHTSGDTLITVTAQRPLSLNDAHLLNNCLFPPNDVESNADFSMQMRNRGRGHGRGGRFSSARKSSSSSMPSINLIQLSSKTTDLTTLIKPARFVNPTRPTWLMSEMGKTISPTEAHQVQTESDAERVISQRFDLFDYIDTRDQTAEADEARKRRYFIYSKEGADHGEPSRLTSFASELRKNESVRRLFHIFQSPAQLKQFFTMATMIRVTLGLEAIKLWNDYIRYAVSHSAKTLQVYTSDYKHLVHRVACCHARLHLRSEATLADMCVGIMMGEEMIGLRYGSTCSALKWSRFGMTEDQLNMNTFKAPKKAKQSKESNQTEQEKSAKAMMQFYQKLLISSSSMSPSTPSLSHHPSGSGHISSRHSNIANSSSIHSQWPNQPMSTQLTASSNHTPIMHHAHSTLSGKIVYQRSSVHGSSEIPSTHITTQSHHTTPIQAHNQPSHCVDSQYFSPQLSSRPFDHSLGTQPSQIPVTHLKPSFESSVGSSSQFKVLYSNQTSTPKSLSDWTHSIQHDRVE